MKELILKNYYDSILRSLQGLEFKEWENLYHEVLDVFGKTFTDLEKVLKNYTYNPDTKEPFKDILQFIISSFISEDHPSELWNKVVRIHTETTDSPYGTKTKHIIIVYTKKTILYSMSSFWLWNNYEEAKEFMEETEYYKKIIKLSGKYVEV